MSEVSIIIPNYNKGNYLEETLASCLSQDLGILKEIIIVDDNSTDNSWNILKYFNKKYPDLIQIYKNPKKGASAARNFGFIKSSGNYIQWLDSDDVLGENKIKAQLDFLKNKNAEICHCKWVRFHGSLENLIGGYGPHENIRNQMSPLDFLCNEYNMVALHSWLAKRSLYEKTTGWNEDLSLNDDGEFMSRVISISSQVFYVESVVAFYRSNLSDSLSQLDNNKLESLFKSIESFEQTILNITQTENYKHRVAISNKYYEFIHVTYNYRTEFRKKAYKKIKIYGEPNFYNYVNLSKYGFLYLIFGWKVFEFLKVVKSYIKMPKFRKPI